MLRFLAPAAPPAVAAIVAGALLAAGTARSEAQEAVQPVTVRRARISGYPYVYYTPETQLAVGVGGIVTFYTSAHDTVVRPSKVTVSAYYSTRKQFKVSLTPQLYFDENRWLASLPVDFGVYVDKFWGVGNQALDTLDEDYDSEAFGGKLDVQGPLTLFGASRTGVVVEIRRTNIVDPRNNPFLASDTLTGANGGASSGVGVRWVRDTRDHTFFPNRGWLAQVKVVAFSSVIGSDFDYTLLEVDLRRYLARGPDQVLALQAYGTFLSGDPPFYALSALGGGSQMRGYYQGRYRDRHYAMAQAEYRQYVWGRLGVAAFAGAGDVFGSEASDLTFENLKFTLGGGLRFKFNQAEKVNLRVDVGFGRGTSGVYFGLEEAV